MQRALDDRLYELDLRAEHSEPLDGYVTEACYLGRAPALLGWYERAKRWLRGWSADERSLLRLLPPFDARGRDVHGLLAGEQAPPLDGVDDPIGAVRIARGRVAPLHPRSEGDELVLRDLWSKDAPAWRATDMVDFALVLSDKSSVAVCCAQCPLVIAAPEPCDAARELSTIDPEAQKQCRAEALARGSEPIEKVSLRVGDEVEALGVVWHPARCEGRFDVQGRGAPFRSSGIEAVQLVLGDQRGLRMVLRKL